MQWNNRFKLRLYDIEVYNTNYCHAKTIKRPFYLIKMRQLSDRNNATFYLWKKIKVKPGTCDSVSYKRRI